jgi:nicotinamide-nucleotide adenylyltransferase
MGPPPEYSFMRGCTIGRFQPYHRGHHRLIETISEDVDELVLGIGSAYDSHVANDPFTAGERLMMCTQALEDVDLRTYVVPIEDIDRHAVWVSHVESLCPRFDVVYANNPLVVQLFEEAGYEVRRSPLYDRQVYSGTEIRRRMCAHEDWRTLVPDAVVDVIEEIDGVERLREIHGTDTHEIDADGGPETDVDGDESDVDTDGGEPLGTDDGDGVDSTPPI